MVRNSRGLCTYRLGGLAGLTGWGRIAGGHPHHFCRLDRHPAGRFGLWGATGPSDPDQAAGPQRYRGLLMRPGARGATPTLCRIADHMLAFRPTRAVASALAQSDRIQFATPSRKGYNLFVDFPEGGQP
jgi:hypothetical protein